MSHVSQNVLPIEQYVVEELGHQECSPLVLLARHIQLFRQGSIVKLQLFVMTLSLPQLLFDVLQFLLEEVNHFFIAALIVLRLR